MPRGAQHSCDTICSPEPATRPGQGCADRVGETLAARLSGREQGTCEPSACSQERKHADCQPWAFASLAPGPRAVCCLPCTGRAVWAAAWGCPSHPGAVTPVVVRQPSPGLAVVLCGLPRSTAFGRTSAPPHHSEHAAALLPCRAFSREPRGGGPGREAGSALVWAAAGDTRGHWWVSCTLRRLPACRPTPGADERCWGRCHHCCGHGTVLLPRPFHCLPAPAQTCRAWEDAGALGWTLPY